MPNEAAEGAIGEAIGEAAVALSSCVPKGLGFGPAAAYLGGETLVLMIC